MERGSKTRKKGHSKSRNVGRRNVRKNNESERDRKMKDKRRTEREIDKKKENRSVEKEQERVGKSYKRKTEN